MPIIPIQPMPQKKPKQIFTDLRSLFAKIGIKVIKNAFHSDNYVSGSAGWKISQSGTIEAQTLVSGAFIKVFRQAAIPVSEHIGDIWIDTDDDNKLYYADSVGADQITAGEWVLAGDFNAANWAKVTGTGKPADNATVNATFKQANIPTSLAIGDLWVDTDDKNKLYRAESVGANEIAAGEWVLVRDTDIAQALADAATAITNAATAQGTADGKVVTFIQATAPTAEGEGDLWIDSDDGNKLYRWSGAAWVEIQDDAIATALTNASNAQATADGKIVTFIQTTAPTAEGEGDLWIDSDDGNKLYRWDGDSWNAVDQTIFKGVSIGGANIQYLFGDAGILSFGDGSDGALSTTGNVTLTTDKYYTDLTINNGHTFNPAGYRVFVKGTLTIKAGGILARDGNNGQQGQHGGASPGGGAGGTALADGYLKGSLVGAKGGDEGQVGVNGTGTSNSIGSNGKNGGAGGDGTGGAGYAGGTGGTATASNVKLIANWHLATLLDISSTGASVKFDNSASGAGGGSGGFGDEGHAGPGGGAGSGGGIIAIYARIIVIEATGILRAIGGNGGQGAWQYSITSGGGGGGAGGNGGQIILVYNSLTNGGTISVAGGTGGLGGTIEGGGGTRNGSPGQDGTAGTIRYFQLSL